MQELLTDWLKNRLIRLKNWDLVTKRLYLPIVSSGDRMVSIKSLLAIKLKGSNEK